MVFYEEGDQDRLRLLMNVTDATQFFFRICWEIFINGLRTNTDNISHLMLGSAVLKHSMTTFGNLRRHYPAAAQEPEQTKYAKRRIRKYAFCMVYYLIGLDMLIMFFILNLSIWYFDIIFFMQYGSTLRSITSYEAIPTNIAIKNAAIAEPVLL